jgi:tetratricopeptide (TPR) repeat protein
MQLQEHEDPMMATRVLLSSLAIALSLLVVDPARADDGAIIKAFVSACKEDKNLDDAKRKQILSLVERKVGEEADRSSTITGALRVIYPEFQQALVAVGDEEWDVAGKKLGELAKSEGRFLADDAKFYLARVHMNDERYEAALPLLKAITEPANKPMTLHQGEALFMRAVCETGMLDRKQAIASFKRFLEENPQAAERLRVGAEHQLAELELISDGSLLDIQARMEASRRLLGLENSGEETQEQQEKIITLLTALIEEAEEKEQQGKGTCEKCGKPKGSKPGQCPGGGKCPGGSKPGGSGSGGGTGKPGRGGAEGGEGNSSDATELARRTFNGGRSAWDKMRKQDYEKVLSALKAKYPGGRYSKLAEEYRRSLQEEEN